MITPSVQIFSFNETTVAEQTKDQLINIENRDPNMVYWINLDDIGNVQQLDTITDALGIHKLIRDDILNLDHRPKVEFFEDCVFVVLKMITFDEITLQIESEQVSLILKDNTVLSFQERVGDVFDSVRTRIRQKRGRVRSKKADYLLYALLDSVIASDLQITEKLSEQIEVLEEKILEQSDNETLPSIYRYKRQLIELKRSVYAMRDLLKDITNEDSEFIDETTEKYFRDSFDHAKTLSEAIDTQRELLTHLIEIYLSQLSQKTNDVMKVLTIVSTIFIPLTFIAGIYGMNFDFMPELKFEMGYPITIAIMTLIALGTLVFFRKKDWL